MMQLCTYISIILFHSIHKLVKILSYHNIYILYFNKLLIINATNAQLYYFSNVRATTATVRSQ
jgi:hypothetical protein